MEKIHLSNAEWEIMNILWKFPEATITQIVAELNKKKFILQVLQRSTRFTFSRSDDNTDCSGVK